MQPAAYTLTGTVPVFEGRPVERGLSLTAGQAENFSRQGAKCKAAKEEEAIDENDVPAGRFSLPSPLFPFSVALRLGGLALSRGNLYARPCSTWMPSEENFATLSACPAVGETGSDTPSTGDHWKISLGGISLVLTLHCGSGPRIASPPAASGGKGARRLPLQVPPDAAGGLRGREPPGLDCGESSLLSCDIWT